MPLSPLPTGLAKLHLGISGLASLLRAPFKEGFVLSSLPPTTACVPFHPPLSSIPGPVHKPVPILPHPTLLPRWASQRPQARGRQAPGRFRDGSPVPDRQTDRQMCSRHTETWKDLKTLIERRGDRDITDSEPQRKQTDSPRVVVTEPTLRTSRGCYRPQRQRGL